MKTLALIAALALFGTAAKADTVLNFALSDPSGNTVSFDLTQGQLPDTTAHECYCGQAVTDSEYLNVPMVVDGVQQTENVFFTDSGSMIGAGIRAGDLDFWGAVWSGSLGAPTFELGTFTSEFDCFGQVVPACGQQTAGILTVTDPPPIDTPEAQSGLTLLLGLGLLASLWALHRRSPHEDSTVEQVGWS